MNQRLFPYLGVVAVATLIGLSLAKVTSSDPWVPSIGAAVLALVAVGIASLFRPQTVLFEKATPARKLMGMRVGVVGFVIALSGWLVAVFSSATIGYYIAVFGVAIGFVGMAIHYYNLFRK